MVGTLPVSVVRLSTLGSFKNVRLSGRDLPNRGQSPDQSWTDLGKSSFRNQGPPLPREPLRELKEHTRVSNPRMNGVFLGHTRAPERY